MVRRSGRAKSLFRSKWLTPGRFLVLGFLGVILTGTLLLMMPFSAHSGLQVGFVNALFTSTSAVCVTGLSVVDTADTYTVFGRVVIAALIQTGGLGFGCIGIFFILLSGKSIGLRQRVLLKESYNLNTLKGVVRLVKAVVAITLCFELVGLALSYVSFSRHYPPLQALGISAFHAVSAFNNAGFDVLVGFRNLIDYHDDVLLNLTTCALIIFGGLGFYVISEILKVRSLRALSMNTKIVLTMTVVLLVTGTVALKLTEDVTWLGAFFQSTSARTAGFATYAMGGFTATGQFILILLMFIGASPGSTGGGIKTTTMFTLVKAVFSFSTNRSCSAFRRTIAHESITKAYAIVMLALAVISLNVLLLTMMQPQHTFLQVLFEVVSAFGTVGLSTGITPELHPASKVLLCAVMFIGRLGPLTVACIWSYQPSVNLSYAEERVTIG